MIYGIGVIISTLWCLRLIHVFKGDWKLTLNDYIFIVVSFLFSWMTVFVFINRCLFGHDADLLRWKRKEKNKTKTYHFKL